MAILETTVAVLGAGWAGVSASYELAQQGATFLLVEGGSHIGGRSRKAEFGGYIVEDGSNWIQGVGNSKKGHANPIWELAERYGLAKIKKKKHPFKNVGKGSIQQNYESYVVYDVNGDLVADKDIRWDDMESAFECLNQRGLDLNLAFWDDGTIEDPMDVTQRMLLKECGWTPDSPLDDLIEWWDMDWEWGHSPASGTGYSNPVFGYKDYDEEDEFIIDQRGFQYLAESLAEEFLEEDDERLLMQTAVTNINWQPTNCPDTFEEGCVEITTNTTDTIFAEYAIVTFSVGVLKHDHEALFSPSLPQENKDALDSLNIGLYTKIFMQFEEKFWDNVEFILTATTKRGASNLWQNLDTQKQLPGSHILFQTVTEDLASAAELGDDDEIKKEQLDYLRVVYGDAVTDPINFYVARFLEDPLFRAGWGDWGTHTSPDVSYRLRSPLINGEGRQNVYISGEASCRRYNSYTHGGFLAGKRDALEIMAELEYDVELELACENQEMPDAGPPYGNKPNKP